MKKISKLKAGDKVAVLSPSFAAPGKFPAVYELGLKRLRDIFKLDPVEFPTTRKLGASTEERAKDLIAAYEDPAIKAVIATIGGDDQVTYIKHLPHEPFVQNPKIFLGYSDNTHLMNFLWLCGIPSYYGGSIMTQFGMQGEMDDYTVKYLQHALFDSGEIELQPSEEYNEIGLDWSDESNISKRRVYEKNDGWYWDGESDVAGITWGGCLESIDEMLRHGITIPSLDDFKNVVLLVETSEEIPSHEYVFRVFRALGERGILERVRAIIVGRAKAWEFDKPYTLEKRLSYRKQQRGTILKVVREYNNFLPLVQNMDFGHTDPQIPVPYGMHVRIISSSGKIFANF